jgi:PEP-CTERM motif
MRKSALSLILVLALVGCAASVARADGTGDPTVIINKIAGPPPSDCPEGFTCFTTNSQSNPLFLPGDNSVTDFLYEGTTDLSELFVEFPFVSGEVYTCSSDIFASCGTVEPAVFQSTDIEFEFSNGTLAPGDAFAAIVTPEPGAWLLFGIGFMMFCALWRRNAMSS